MRTWRRFARGVYRANRATRTAQAWASGNPKRVERLYVHRIAYHWFAKAMARLFR